MKWFYTLRNHVKGPFGNDEFEIALKNLGADLKEAFVWTRGKAEWSEAERWTIADAEKIEAQAHSVAIMQTLAPALAAPAQNQQPAKAKATTKPAQAVQKPARPNLDPQATNMSAATLKVKMPSQPTLTTEPVDIILPTDDEITKLLGVSAIEVIESIKQNADEKQSADEEGGGKPGPYGRVTFSGVNSLHAFCGSRGG